jgi:hypothetical protein
MKFLKILLFLLVLTTVFTLIGCMSANQHYRQTHGPKEKEMTVGTVQKEIRKGMSAADVATVKRFFRSRSETFNRRRY